MSFVVANWKLLLIAALSALCVLLFNLWQDEKMEYATFKAGVVVLGQEMERRAKAQDALHANVLKEIRDEWNREVPQIQAKAVDNFRRRFPGGLCGSNSGSGTVPPTASVPERADGAVEERVAPEQPSPERDFVGACGEDVGKLRKVRDWVRRNGLKVE